MLYRFRTFLIAAENFLQILYIRKYLLKKIVGRDKRLRAARAKRIADAIFPHRLLREGATARLYSAKTARTLFVKRHIAAASPHAFLFFDSAFTANGPSLRRLLQKSA